MKITAAIVNRSNKFPIANARVSVGIGTSELAVLYTDDQGHLTYADDNPHRDQTVVCRIEKDGFEQREIRSVITQDTLALEIELIPRPQAKAGEPHAKKTPTEGTDAVEHAGLKLLLHLKDQKGRPAAGISVSCRSPGFKLAGGVSDDKGNAHILLTKSETA